MAPLELEVVEVDGASYHGESQFDVESVLRNDKESMWWGRTSGA